jgi:transposase
VDNTPAETIYKSGKAVVITKLMEFSSELETLKGIMVALEGRIQQLENHLAKDSHNSSKPPSSDGLKKQKRTQSQRHPTNRNVGGQQGHHGHTLEMVDNPLTILKHAN